MKFGRASWAGRIAAACTGLEQTVGTLVIAIAFCLLLFVALDAVIAHFLSVVRPSSSAHLEKDLYFKPYPYIMYKGRTDKKSARVGLLNQLGYRGPVPSQPKPQAELRIVVLGGSTVLFGDPAIPELLQNLFRAAGHSQVMVYNFGVAASVLQMDIARLVFEVSDYEPDLVIFYGGGNDIGMPFQGDPRPQFPPNFLAYEANPLLLAGTPEQRWGALFKIGLLQSRIVREIKGREISASLVPLAETREQVGWNTPEWSRMVAETYLATIKRAIMVSKGFSSESYFVFQPILAFKLHRSAEEQGLHDPQMARHAALCRSLITKGLASLSDEKELRYLDLSSIFDAVEASVFYDGIHIKQEYNLPIARRIFTGLSESGYSKGWLQ